MSSFLKRSLSGLVYVALFVSAILYSDDTYIILTSIFSILCLREFQRLINSTQLLTYLVLLGGISYVVFLPQNEWVTKVLLALNLLMSIQLILYLFSAKTTYPKGALQKFDASTRYVTLSFITLILLPFVNEVYNYQIVLSLVLFIWTNDSFAYLVGKNFGKHKLFEKVSPKKTIEGFIGGVIFTVITGIVVSYYFEMLSMKDWVVLSIITAIVGTIGDLVESKFKRQAQIKDSGNIMPGHGGLLDRLDSLLFVAPFVYLYIHYLI